MPKRFTPDTYLQVDRPEEMYAAMYRCMTCRGAWSGVVNYNPAYPDEYPGVFRFCPCCGISFKGELKRLSERREELRRAAGWKCHDWAKAQEIEYVIQRRVEWSDHNMWTVDYNYFPKGTRHDVLRVWHYRLRDSSLFGEEVRLVAKTPSGKEQVVFGPVILAPDSQLERVRTYRPDQEKEEGLLDA